MSPLSPTELHEEQRRVVWRAIFATGFCAAILTAGFFALPRWFRFPTELAERLAFAIQADVFVLLWIMLGVRMVARGRFVSAADNRGSAFAPPSPAIAVPVAFLQNTMEQAVIAIGAHLALASLVAGPALAVIPAAVLLFAIGRWTFLVGYPKGASGRAFGIVATVIPTLAIYGWVLCLIAQRLFEST